MQSQKETSLINKNILGEFDTQSFIFHALIDHTNLFGKLTQMLRTKAKMTFSWLNTGIVINYNSHAFVV